MKKAALALAALTFAAFGAFSGTAFAGDNQPAKQVSASTCTGTKTKVDCGPTGSIEKASPTGTRNANGPRLGIDANPWILPTTF